MDTDALRHDVHAFRRVLENCHGDLDATIFSCFPRGCCGAVSELLAVFLESRGHGAFTYVSGRKVDDDNRFLSHAWLEQGGLIIDVTRDQFDERSEAVFAATDRSWHDRRFPEQERSRGLGEWLPELCRAYARIQEEIGAGAGPE